MLSWFGVFQFGIFSSTVLGESRCMFTSGTCSSSFNSFIMLFIHLAFVLGSFFLHILLQNRLVSFASGCWFFSTNRVFLRYFGMFSFVLFVWHCPGTFWSLLFSPISFLFHPVRLVYFGHFVVFSFLFGLPVCFNFLCSFACCCTFFICSSTSPDFVFLFRFPWVMLILFLTRIAPAYINMLSSVMLSIGMCCNILVTFLVSNLTFFQFWFLTDGNVVFRSLITFFIFNSTFFLSFCVDIDVFLCSVMIWLSIFCVLIHLRSILWVYSSRFACSYISSILRPDNQPFLKINFASSASFLLLLNLADSVQISIIRFLYSLCGGLLLNNNWLLLLLSYSFEFFFTPA